MTAYLVESSVWVAHFRGVSSSMSGRLQSLREAEHFVTVEPVAMELLAGVAADRVHDVEALLDSMPTLALDAHADFRSAARIYRDARADGHTIRSMIDCLIAAIVVRNRDVVLIHNDVDFERIASVCSLSQERWPTTT